MSDFDRKFLKIAIEEALAGSVEGGVPVGACLVHEGSLVSTGRNRRQQRQTVILHGETDCIGNAGLFDGFAKSTLYTSLSPCMMCAGTIVQFRIPRVVIADATNFGGNEEFLRAQGVEVEILEDDEMVKFFSKWKKEHLEIWNGDIGK